MLGSTRTVVTAAGANAEGYTYYPYGLLNEAERELRSHEGRVHRQGA
jgi:hypothetical protein